MQNIKQKKKTTEENSIQQLAFIAARAADDKKGEDITIIDVSKLTTIADYFIVITVKSMTQIRAISDNIIDELKNANYNKRSVEGIDKNGWTVVDFGDIVIHIMTEEQRQYYKLESFWSNGKIINEKTWKKVAE